MLSFSASSRESARRLERRTTYFSGAVQGVGFRATAERIASGYSIGGTVRNLRDGRVELIAEGEAPELDRFLSHVVGRFSGSIDHVETIMDPIDEVRTTRLTVAY
jgi:acylphosphatase